MGHPTNAACRTRSGRRIAAAIALALGLGVPASSALFAAESTAVNGAALSAGLQQADRVGGPPTTTIPPPPPTSPPTTAPGRQIPAAAQAVLDLTNAERANRGIAPLTYHFDLAAAAAIHGNDQSSKPCGIGSLSHTGSDGSNTGDRIARTGLRVRDWAENIACGFSTPQAVVNAWMSSAGHRTNILNPRLTHMGVSLTSLSDGSPYWVQVFALPR